MDLKQNVLSPNIIEKNIIDLIPKDSKKILVFGCDDGIIGYHIKQHLKSVYLVGVEEDKELSILAQKYFDDVINTSVSNSHNYIKKQKYDCIIYCNIHKYFVDPLHTLEIHKNFLKKKGIFIFTFHNAQFGGYIEDLVNNGLVQALVHLGLESNCTYNFDKFSTIIVNLDMSIKSIFGIVSPSIYKFEGKTPIINLKGLRIITPNIQKLTQFFTHYYIVVVTLEPPEIQIPGKIFPITVEDLRSLSYRHPEKYWENYGKYMFLDKFQWDKPETIKSDREYLCKKILELKPESILEIGCGSGENLNLLREYDSKVKLAGIDISSSILSYTEKKLKNKQIKLYKYNQGDPLPFKTNSFDIVFTSTVLCMCYPDIMNKLREEIKRVSRKYIFHFEELTSYDIRFFGYNLEEIYKSEGCNIKFVENKEYENERKSQFLIVNMEKNK